MKKICSLLLSLLFLLPVFVISPSGEKKSEELTILFTHDTHDYLYPTSTYDDGKTVYHGGAGRLVTLLKQNKTENTLYLDGGDFSMGTLYQAAYATDAYELRNLGIVGCSVTTFGNHEFDYDIQGVVDMLHSALSSGDTLPQIVQSNIDLSGTLTEEQQKLKDAFDEYGVKENTILSCGGYQIGIFGLMGYDCIECTQADLNYIDYIESAKTQVQKLKEAGCDLIIALSHSGTNGDGETGEDIDLANQVDGIDLIISGHTHTTYDKPVTVNDTVIVSCGEYLKNLGKITICKENGKLRVSAYELLPINETVAEDEETVKRFETYKQKIEETYLAEYGLSFDTVIAHSNYNLISLNEMYATHQEYTMGNIIADSYLYEAKRNGITDIDVALVGLGTIRGSIKEGNITVADAFEICSLGVGADGSAGHPIVCAYITGHELKLLCELDASLAPYVNSIKMSYSGISYTFNSERVILDRVTEIHLVREDGTTEEIDDGKLYKVCANMYAVNMLGMLNGLTKGILSITPKDKNGNKVTDFYSVSMKTEEGKEIKEWVAFCNYLSSFEKNESGVSELPETYTHTLNRKTQISDNGIVAISKPGAAVTIISGIAIGLHVFFGILFVLTRVIHHRKKRLKKATAGGKKHGR